RFSCGSRDRITGADHESSRDTVRAELRHGEARRALPGAIPVHAVHETADVRRKTRRTVEPARRRHADPGAQQPQKARDVIDVRMSDEDIRDLMRNARAETMRLAEIEQERAAPMLHARSEERRVGKERRSRRTPSRDEPGWRGGGIEQGAR